MLIARSELPPLPVAIPIIGLLVIAIAVGLIRVSVRRLVCPVSVVTVVPTPIRLSISVRRLVCPISVSIVTVIPVPIRTPMYPAINARNATWSEGTTNHG
jgi:hypothetical protein